MGAAVVASIGFVLALRGRSAREALDLAIGQRVRIWLGDDYQALEADEEGGFRIIDLYEVRDVRLAGAIVAAGVRVERVRGQP
jgi:hypothetical protein